MKSIYITILFILSAISSTFAQDITLNPEKSLELKEVVQVEGMTKNDIYVAANSMLSNWIPNANSKSSIDFADLETGTIILKGKIFLGFKKANMLYGYNNYAIINCTIRCKDGKYQVIIKVPSMEMEWSANQNPASETVPIEHLYPSFDGYKTKLYQTKGSMKEFGPLIPEAMTNLMNAIKQKIVKLDDF